MQLTGPEAFYNQPSYEQQTRSELRRKEPNPPIYTYENGHSWARLAKNIIFNGSSIALIYSISRYCIKIISRGHINLPQVSKKCFWAILPFGLYNNLYVIVGRLIHPATHMSGQGLEEAREEFLGQGREVKRVSIKANGYVIDAVIMGKKENLGNGRWIIFSNGNGQHYENFDKLKLLFADSMKANIILYNYASTGRSSGKLPNREAILASHRAVLSFAEGAIGATEIIDFAHSIGGGIQGENLKKYPLKGDVKYVFVKNKTFSSVSTIASRVFGLIGTGAIRLLNWEYSSVESSRLLQHSEIIIQQGGEFENYWAANKQEDARVGENRHMQWETDYLGGRVVSLSMSEEDENTPFLIAVDEDASFKSRLDMEEIDEILLGQFMQKHNILDQQSAKKRIYEEYLAHFIDNHIPKPLTDGHIGFSKVVRKWTWKVMSEAPDERSIRKVELLEQEGSVLKKVLNLAPALLWRISFNKKHVILEKGDLNARHMEMTNTDQLAPTDGVIKRNESLANALFTNASCPKHNKTFCLVAEGHNYPMYTSKSIAQTIERKLGQ